MTEVVVYIRGRKVGHPTLPNTRLDRLVATTDGKGGARRRG